MSALVVATLFDRDHWPVWAGLAIGAVYVIGGAVLDALRGNRLLRPREMRALDALRRLRGQR